jgi:C_GCAxxG_C_C family probable redox protein
MNGKELACSRFKEGFSCSQAVFSAYAEQLGLDRETALKIAGAFGGGMGRMAQTCGAVTGAFMVIGLKYGAIGAEDKETKEKAYALVREFVDRFKSRHGSIACQDLLGCDISKPEGEKVAREQKLFETICPKLVKDAAELLEEMLAE